MAPFRRVVFVDWHGVLSNRTFWDSIDRSPHHPFQGVVSEVRKRIFEGDASTLESWMRGQMSTSEIIRSFPVRRVQDRRFGPRFLERRLLDECVHMPLNTPLVHVLHDLATSWQIVIATDNMDFFQEAAWSRRDIRSFANAIISSATVGVLKAESPEHFFGPWLTQCGIDVRDTVLIDDSPANCAAFERFGGTAVLVESYGRAGEITRAFEASQRSDS
jgi:FMN phosphatase YigB (HAD superfamily)